MTGGGWDCRSREKASRFLGFGEGGRQPDTPTLNEGEVGEWWHARPQMAVQPTWALSAALSQAWIWGYWLQSCGRRVRGNLRLLWPQMTWEWPPAWKTKRVVETVSCSVISLCDPMDCSLPAPLSMEFSRQEYWSGLLFPSPGEDLPDLGIEPGSPALQADFLPSEPLGKSQRVGGSQQRKVVFLISLLTSLLLA